MYIQAEKNNSRKNESIIQRLFVNGRATGYNWNGQNVWHNTARRGVNHRTVFFTNNPGALHMGKQERLSWASDSIEVL